jgi:hypothetical protein
MSSTDLYVDYEDGNMSPQQENEFFQRLASDKDFRKGYKSFQSIATSVSKASSLVAPADNLTSDIFASLGVTTKTPVSVPLLQKAGFKNIFLPLLTSVITFIIAWFLFRGVDIHEKEGFRVNDNHNYPNNECYTNLYQTKRIVTGIKNENENTVIDTVIQVVYLKKESNNEKIESNVTEHKSQQFTSAINVVDTQFDSKIDCNAEKNKINHLNFNPVPCSPLFNNFFKPDIDVEVFGSNYFSLSSVDAAMDPQSGFNNLSLSIMKNFNNRWSGGLEYRQETFICRYADEDAARSEFNVYGQPSFSTFSLNTRYKYFENQYIGLFSELGIGANRLGLVVRPEVGVDVYSLSRFTLRIGLDYSLFTYKYHEIWYSSSKFGLNYGIKFNF